MKIKIKEIGCSWHVWLSDGWQWQFCSHSKIKLLTRNWVISQLLINI